MSVSFLVNKVLRYKVYYGEKGGVTVSGGEPLIQAEFLTELFKALKQRGIHTALDTSGCILDDKVKELLQYTDLVLLDFKYTNEEDYLKYTGMEYGRALEFLQYLEDIKKEAWIRCVIIPDLNDGEESIERIISLRQKYSCVKKIELLPFRKLCLEKYNELGMEFPLKDTPETKQSFIDGLYKKYEKALS
jgi:pyruvate formate lyase activating enzyme